MILQALVKRYEDTQDVPPGWQKREVSYALEIDENGKLLTITSTGKPDDKKRGKLELILPTIGKGRSGKSAYQTAFFLCDDGNYILGLDPLKFESARKLHTELLKDVDTPAAKAIVAYFQSPPELPQETREDKEYIQAKYVFSFHLRRVDFKDGDAAILESWNNAQARKIPGKQIRCLATGREDEVVKLHDKVALPGITMGAQPLISMNDQTSFRSYGSKPGDPAAMIGQSAAFAYATALDALLKDKSHRMLMGGDTVVYWAEKGGDKEEDMFAHLLDPPKTDAAVELAEAAKRIVRGDYVSDFNADCRCYLMCLSPNAARISVRFFYEDSFGNLTRNIRAHYARLAIVGDGRMPFSLLPIWLLLSETTLKQSAADAAPLLAGQVFKAVITDSLYPFTLYNAMLTRIRSGGSVNQTKAAVIKAALIKNFNESEVTTVALNEQSENTPYVLGRLFAVLEMLQERANGSSNVRERYFTSASANPGSIFPTLLNLSVHHSAKLDNPVFFEKLKTTLIARLDGENPFPAALAMDDQGRFIVGYYHQRQAFFTKKDTVDKEETANEQ
ncbi:MAG: type I-C CRISPR-associated protein Cas8c/Csd1 [Clostridiales bacterium]|jgi:CRISPR-associated protein Csd1|nr:type I-C CRISPR-associated protein Cas8c/Csd1 [Clostridiales bacterium]